MDISESRSNVMCRSVRNWHGKTTAYREALFPFAPQFPQSPRVRYIEIEIVLKQNNSVSHFHSTFFDTLTIVAGDFGATTPRPF